MLGEMPTSKALQMAADAGMDLVEVSPDARPPVCRIMDYGKAEYERHKKQGGGSTKLPRSTAQANPAASQNGTA